MANLYTVARQDGDNAEYNLTLEEAAHRILTDDGREYKLQKHDQYGFDLWCRQEVANIGWSYSGWYSLEDDEDDAWREIAGKVVKASQGLDWRGPVAWQSTRVMLDGQEVDFDAAVALMDADLREAIHDEPRVWSSQDFLDAYVQAHAEKFGGEQFTVN